jgi:hypothetical protein
LLPLDALAKVHIIDTPGLNSILPEHEATARAFIGRADAVVWVFTAGQGGKASERKALDAIRAEGKRVLGVLNKRDQLGAAEVREVVDYVAGELGDRVEVIVPFSARAALAWKRNGGDDDGGWATLSTALEERFFAQARAIKRGAVARRLLATIATARTTIAAVRTAATERADRERAARERVAAAAAAWPEAVVDRERRAIATAVGELYRLAATEVIELVRPRQLPFGSHSATPADRDYLVGLLSDGYEAMLRAAGERVGAELRATLVDEAAIERAIATATAPLHYARAYVAGFLAGGAVDNFFKHDLPRLALEHDTVHHALFRAAPDLEALVADPLGRAGLAGAGRGRARDRSHRGAPRSRRLRAGGRRRARPRHPGRTPRTMSAGRDGQLGLPGVGAPVRGALTLGVDEAGRGPILGPMVVAVVALDAGAARALTRAGVCDSKAVAGKDAIARRAALAALVRARAPYVALCGGRGRRDRRPRRARGAQPARA